MFEEYNAHWREKILELKEKLLTCEKNSGKIHHRGENTKIPEVYAQISIHSETKTSSAAMTVVH